MPVEEEDERAPSGGRPMLYVSRAFPLTVQATETVREGPGNEAATERTKEERS